MTSTSSQRLARGEPGTFVWASSSTSATVGRRAMIGVGIHLLDDDAAVLDATARDDLEAVEQLERVRPPVRLDEADHDVRAALAPSMALLEHAVRLADAGRHAQVDAQPSAAARRLRADRARASRRRSGGRRTRRAPDRSSASSSPSRSRFSSRTWTRARRGSPNSGCSVCRATIARTASGRHAARRRDAGDLVLGRRRADVGVEARRRGRDRGPRGSARRRWRPGSAATRVVDRGRCRSWFVGPRFEPAEPLAS